MWRTPTRTRTDETVPAQARYPDASFWAADRHTCRSALKCPIPRTNFIPAGSRNACRRSPLPELDIRTNPAPFGWGRCRIRRRHRHLLKSHTAALRNASPDRTLAAPVQEAGIAFLRRSARFRFTGYHRAISRRPRPSPIRCGGHGQCSGTHTRRCRLPHPTAQGNSSRREAIALRPGHGVSFQQTRPGIRPLPALHQAGPFAAGWPMPGSSLNTSATWICLASHHGIW